MSWDTQVVTTGNIDSGDEALAVSLRNARLSAQHLSPTATDDIHLTALIDQAQAVLGAINVPTSEVYATFSAGEGALQFSLSAQTGATVDIHSWSTQAVARPVGAELPLMRALMDAGLAAHGDTASPQDDAIYNAVILAAQAFVTLLDPGATAESILVDISGQVSVGSFSNVAVNLSVSARQPVVAGAAVAPLTFLKKPGDSTSNSNTVVQDIAGLEFPMLASTDYWFAYDIIFRTAALTTGIALGMNGPAGFTALGYAVAIPFAADGADSQWEGSGTAYNDLVISTGVPALNTDYIARIYGIVRNGLNAGPLVPRFRSEVNASLVTVKAGSFGRIVKV